MRLLHEGALLEGRSLPPLSLRQVALRGAPVLEIEVKVAGLPRQDSPIHGSAAAGTPLPPCAKIIVAAHLQGAVHASLEDKAVCNSPRLDRHHHGADQHASMQHAAET